MRSALIAVLHLTVLGSLPVVDAHGADTPGIESSAGEAPKLSQRLKYRRGPVCMCVNGLSEKEIAAAERRRLERLRGAPDSGDIQDRND